MTKRPTGEQLDKIIDAALKNFLDSIPPELRGSGRSPEDYLQSELEEVQAAVRSLFAAIEHGDAEHRSWLKAKITEHFSMVDFETP